jgi:beta-glucosidase
MPQLSRAAVVVVLLAGCTAVTAGQAHAASTLLSHGKSVAASSVENAGTPASAAVDGAAGTRWSTASSATRHGSRSASAAWPVSTR